MTERFALLGVSVVMAFVLFRASSICHEELFSCGREFGKKLNVFLEWLGITMVLGAALFRRL